MRSIQEIEPEILAGMPATNARRTIALANEDFYGCRNYRHLEMREGETPRDFDRRPKRYSRWQREAWRSTAKSQQLSARPEITAGAKNRPRDHEGY